LTARGAWPAVARSEQATGSGSATTTIAVPTGRDWRVSKADEADQVDGVIALMAALEGAERQPAETRLVGWL
jgi:hypothetical protein